MPQNHGKTRKEQRRADAIQRAAEPNVEARAEREKIHAGKGRKK